MRPRRGIIGCEATMHEQLRAYITAELMREPGYPLRDDEPLMNSGLLDSIALAQLAIYIDEQFGVDIPDTAWTAEQLNTVQQIVARVQQG